MAEEIAVNHALNGIKKMNYNVLLNEFIDLHLDLVVRDVHH